MICQSAKAVGGNRIVPQAFNAVNKNIDISFYCSTWLLMPLDYLWKVRVIVILEKT
jgi:hypothetical protein